MKMREILESASVGATCSGSVAVAEQPLTAAMQRRVMPTTGKYKNSAPPQPGIRNARR